MILKNALYFELFVFFKNRIFNRNCDEREEEEKIITVKKISLRENLTENDLWNLIHDEKIWIFGDS